LEVVSVIAEVIIASIGLVLALYIFVYQKKKDYNDWSNAEIIRKRTNRLEWFKTLVINPKIDFVEKTFDRIIRISDNFSSTSIDEGNNSQHLDAIKEALFIFRVDFIDRISVGSPKISENVKNLIDELLDNITTIVVDEGTNLSHKPTREKKILNEIRHTKNQIIGLVFDYDGTET